MRTQQRVAKCGLTGISGITLSPDVAQAYQNDANDPTGLEAKPFRFEKEKRRAGSQRLRRGASV
jgi:hypothetical protein